MTFEEKNRIKIPATITELNGCDLGVVHVAGMIVLACEAMFQGKSVFFRNPETYLHPATERRIVATFKKMLEMLGKRGVVTATEENPTPPEEPPVPTDPQDDKAQVIKWLSCMEPNKPFAQIGDQRFTTTELIQEVTNDTGVGQLMIGKYLQMRDS
jgi:hypothetical protein